MGALLIGALLWGITCSQAYHYYTHYSDVVLLQLVVSRFTSLLDTVHQILISHIVYTYLITWYSDPLNLLRYVWFLIWRVWLFGRQSILQVSPLIALSLTSFTIEILYYCKMWDDYSYASGAINMAAIGAITVQSVFLLRSSKSGLASTNHVIQRLIVFLVGTGLAISFCAMLSLITVIAMPTTLIFSIFYFLISRLATNSLLLTLNMREGMRAALPNTVVLGSLRFAATTTEVTGSRMTSTCDVPDAAVIV
ncbi:hypothetical protein CERSUDRAFT_68859 [Gelatoporia subvermispora B]|uniref:DUF6534 domain-containing protein n=1 Tax=Ceriporiopsis subvermispora (strain B) TaxID=914234 RepID=M2QJJ8_CERS8|nr:hypothetical protein CERSUDRAFT_68859 [Gelatoporia subvermispora B]